MQPVHEEGGVLELTQAAILGTAVPWAAVAALRLPPGRYRAWGGVLMFVALGAYAREADFHTVLNPQYLGEWGLRYRADWWLNGQVSLWLKLGWVVALATPVVVLLRCVPTAVDWYGVAEKLEGVGVEAEASRA